MRIEAGNFIVRLASSEEDVAAAQRLRYEVFVEEMGATPSAQDAADRRERDRYDPFCEHLLLVDANRLDEGLGVVGVYRLLHSSVANGAGERPGPGFYTAGEYDLNQIEKLPYETLELGRSCVHANYRGSTGMQLLWMAMSQYIVDHKIGLMFGTASFHGQEIEPLREPLAYLWHNHLAPPEIRPRTLEPHYVGMDLMAADDIDKRRALQLLPALMKGYMRLNGFVGDGAFIDREFNTVDVCLVMDTAKITDRYKKFYARRLKRGDDAAAEG